MRGDFVERSDVIAVKTKHITKAKGWQLSVYHLFLIVFVAFWMGVIFAGITLHTRPGRAVCTPPDCGVSMFSVFEVDTKSRYNASNENNIQDSQNKLITRKIKLSDDNENVESKKIILLHGENVWTKYDKWHRYDWRKCPHKHSNCRITTDTSRLSESSAVVYNAARMPPLDHVEKRKHRQVKRVFLSGMTPLKTQFNSEDYDNFFDISITYKSDSTIRIPYWPNDGLLPAMHRPKPEKDTKSLTESEMLDLDDDIKKYFRRSGKDSFMAVTVKNCEDNYYPNLFVKKLQEEGLIHAFALNNSESCLKHLKDTVVLPCKGIATDECVKHHETFKFVMTPDENICKDYTTRDYWISILAWQAVPLLYGAGDYNKHLIPNSYIDCVGKEDYISPSFKKAYSSSQDPMKYYKQFHLWRHQDRVEKFYWQCELCRELDNNEETSKKIIMDKFWNKEDNCGTKLPIHELMRLQLVRTGVIR